MKTVSTYIMSNLKRTMLYIGVTSNLQRRVLEHKVGIGSKFTAKYNLHSLVFFEKLPTIQDAINREKQLKNWHKDWKWNLVKESNPALVDLANDWFRKEELNRDLYLD